MDSRWTAEAQAARWRAAGIPDGYTISQLLYNSASRTLITELRGMKDSTLPRRLLARHKDADKYELVGNPEEDVFFESPVTCENRPILAFNSMRSMRRRLEGPRTGRDWVGLYVFNLETKELNLSATGNSLVIPAPYDERGWVSKILHLSDDACYAYVKVGLGRRQDEGEIKNIYYDYHVARLNLRNRELELISKLENIWF